MVFGLIEKTGWSIEYVVSLSRRQVLALMEGEGELLNLKSDKPIGTKESGVKDIKSSNSSSDVFELLNMPGIGLTDKARQKLAAMKMKQEGK